MANSGENWLIVVKICEKLEKVGKSWESGKSGGKWLIVGKICNFYLGKSG